MTETRSWAEMRTWMGERLLRTTGADVTVWRERVEATGLQSETEVRAWLTEQGVTGYPRTLLLMERFGYPEFFTARADELVDAQYADRPGLRPVYDAVVAAALGTGESHVQARKGYVSLVGPRRTFAVVQASTKSRVDLGLRLPDRSPGGRLLAATSIGNGSCTVRVPLARLEDVDDEVVHLLAEAWTANR